MYLFLSRPASHQTDIAPSTMSLWHLLGYTEDKHMSISYTNRKLAQDTEHTHSVHAHSMYTWHTRLPDLNMFPCIYMWTHKLTDVGMSLTHTLDTHAQTWCIYMTPKHTHIQLTLHIGGPCMNRFSQFQVGENHVHTEHTLTFFLVIIP